MEGMVNICESLVNVVTPNKPKTYGARRVDCLGLNQKVRGQV